MSDIPVSRQFHSTLSYDDLWPRRYGGRTKVLLHEPEVCRECGRVFQSLYPLRCCKDHEGLDSV